MDWDGHTCTSYFNNHRDTKCRKGEISRTFHLVSKRYRHVEHFREPCVPVVVEGGQAEMMNR